MLVGWLTHGDLALEVEVDFLADVEFETWEQFHHSNTRPTTLFMISLSRLEHVNLMPHVDDDGLVSRALVVHPPRRRNRQIPSLHPWI